MFQTASPAGTSQRKRRFVLPLSTFLVAAAFVSAFAFSFGPAGQAHAAPAAYTTGQIVVIIENAFGTSALGKQAVTVSSCESSLNPHAYNSSSGAAGLFQFLPSTWAEFGSGSVYNPTDNANAARKLYNARGWEPWTCQPSTSCPATIQNGSTGSMAMVWQDDLNARYNSKVFPNSPYNFSPLLAVDGQFGLLTQAAVKDFQTAKRIAVDGIVGPQTWHTLGVC